MASSLATLLPLILGLAGGALAAGPMPPGGKQQTAIQPIRKLSLGPRPYWLVDHLEEGALKTKLASCADKEMRPSQWSISHRGGGTMQFPEHTFDSILAGVSYSLTVNKDMIIFHILRNIFDSLT